MSGVSSGPPLTAGSRANHSAVTCTITAARARISSASSPRQTHRSYLWSWCSTSFDSGQARPLRLRRQPQAASTPATSSGRLEGQARLRSRRSRFPSWRRSSTIQERSAEHLWTIGTIGAAVQGVLKRIEVCPAGRGLDDDLAVELACVDAERRQLARQAGIRSVPVVAPAGEDLGLAALEAGEASARFPRWSRSLEPTVENWLSVG